MNNNNNNSAQLCCCCNKEATCYANIGNKVMYVCSQLCNDQLYNEYDSTEQPYKQVQRKPTYGRTRYQRVPTRRGIRVSRSPSPHRRRPIRGRRVSRSPSPRSRRPVRGRRVSRSPSPGIIIHRPLYPPQSGPYYQTPQTDPSDPGMTIVQYPGDPSPLEGGNLNCFEVDCPGGFPEGTKCWRCYELAAPNGSDD